MAIASVVQGTIETESGKVFELDSPKGSTWVESVSSFRYVPTGANKPYTVRQETKKGGDYWYGYRKVVGKLHKKYIGKSSELSTAKLEEIAEALNTPQQSRVTQVTDAVTRVTEVNNQRVTEAVTHRHTAERVTALESQMQALQESLEALRSEMLGKSEGLGNVSKLLNPNAEVTDKGLRIELSNSGTNETFTVPDVDGIESLKEENEGLKRLLDKKSPLNQSDFYLELQKLRERNRELRLKIGEERRSSIVQISDLKRQLEGVTDSKLQNELSNLKIENEKLRADYAALLESSTHVTNKLREEVQELRSQLQTEKSRGEEIWKELSDTEEALAEVRAENLELKKTCGELRSELVGREKELAVALTEVLDLKQISAPGVEFPEAAKIYNQFKAKNPKTKTTYSDVEKILAILEES